KHHGALLKPLPRPLKRVCGGVRAFSHLSQPSQSECVICHSYGQRSRKKSESSLFGYRIWHQHSSAQTLPLTRRPFARRPLPEGEGRRSRGLKKEDSVPLPPGEVGARSAAG